METHARYFLVGIFVLLSFVGILGFFLWLAKKDIDYNVNYYTTYFPGSVTGLSVGGSVSFLGVPVGTVKEIKLNPKNLNVVDITITITKDIPIKEDAYASLELQGLTGYKFVQIYGGSEDSPLLKKKKGQKHPVIPSRYSGVEEIMTLLPRMMNKFTNLIDRINTTFDEQNRKRFSDTLKNVDLLSQRLAESAKPLETLIKDSSHTLHTFEAELKGFSSSAQATFHKIDQIADDFSDYYDKNKVTLNAFTKNGTYELLHTLVETQKMMRTATHFFRKLDGNPRTLLFEREREGIYVPQ